MFLSKIKRYAALILAVILLLSLCSACTKQQSTDKPQTTQTTADSREASYAAALAALADKDYTEAHALLSSLGDYKDAPALLEKFVFRPTEIRWVWNASSTDTQTFTYDERGNCIKIVDDDGNESIFTYDGIGYPTQCVFKVSDTVYFTTRYTYDERGRLTKEWAEESYGTYTLLYEYDGNNRLIRITTVPYDEDPCPDCEVLDLSYDEHGNCIKTYGHYAVGDHVNEYTYDEHGRCIRQINPYGDELTFQYDAYGNCIKRVLTPYYEEDDGWVATYTYEPFYFEDGIPGDWKNFINRFVYDMY